MSDFDEEFLFFPPQDEQSEVDGKRLAACSSCTETDFTIQLGPGQVKLGIFHVESVSMIIVSYLLNVQYKLKRLNLKYKSSRGLIIFLFSCHDIQNVGLLPVALLH